MIKASTQSLSYHSMDLLSQLLLVPRDGKNASSREMAGLRSDVLNISLESFDNLVALGKSNHVIVRGLEVFLNLVNEERDEVRAEWAGTALGVEKARIAKALRFLQDICATFAYEKLEVAVIKSLDHWPDLGSDLDLYTNAHPEDIISLMGRHFNAQIAARSWGDRLAGKWNFVIPGLPESVEIHMGRLGQTGEQVEMASRLLERTRRVMVGNRAFPVTSATDRLMISTLQRMYRHFYFRLCDIVDTAVLSEEGAIDFMDLRSSATQAGIWGGVATYLVIVSDYVKKYGGSGLELPRFVRDAARFGGDEVYFAKEFLRVPIMPQAAGLYGTQLAGLLKKRELQNGARLSLLPWLATAALVGQRFTGSDKGIW
jgi:hypothetical protein